MSDQPRSFSFFIPGPLPGMNELIKAAKGMGGAGYGYSRIKRNWTRGVALLAMASGRQKFGCGPVHIVFVWHEKNKRRDPDNICGGGRKLILDGLVEARVFDTDGWKLQATWSDTFETDSRPGVQVTITEVQL